MNIRDLKIFLKENKDFSYLWTSQVLSQLTINIMNFVMAIRIYERTGSTLAVSFLWIFYFLPSFFLGPFSGFFVDIWPLRKTLFFTNMLQGLIMLIFLFIGRKIYPIYPLVFLYSLVNQFYYPAEAASIPWLVKRKNLSLANSLFMLTQQTSLIFGLGISGILIQLFGKNNPVLLSSVFLFIAALSVSFLPKTEVKLKHAKFDLTKFFSQIKIGYLFIQRSKIVLLPMLTVTFFQIMLLMLAISLPSFAVDILQIRVSDAGPILIIPLGLGALIGTLFITRFFKEVRKKELIKKGMIGTFFVFLFLSLLLPYLGQWRIIFSVLLMFLLGVSIFLIFVPNQTLIQEKTPAHLRGRIFGAWNFISTMATIPFLLFSATIVEVLGIGLFIFFSAAFILFLLLSFNKVEGMINNQKVIVEV